MKIKIITLIIVMTFCVAMLNAQTWDCGDASNEGGASSVTATLSGGMLTIGE